MTAYRDAIERVKVQMDNFPFHELRAVDDVISDAPTGATEEDKQKSEMVKRISASGVLAFKKLFLSDDFTKLKSTTVNNEKVPMTEDEKEQLRKIINEFRANFEAAERNYNSKKDLGDESSNFSKEAHVEMLSSAKGSQLWQRFQFILLKYIDREDIKNLISPNEYGQAINNAQRLEESVNAPRKRVAPMTGSSSAFLSNLTSDSSNKKISFNRRENTDQNSSSTATKDNPENQKKPK